MKLNSEKSKFMLVNFSKNYQFNTRLRIDNQILQQVKESQLLGVVLNDQLTRHSNTDFIVKKAYTRMILLHNLFDFGLPMTEMIDIYILYIRSIVESSAVVWHSSITKSEEMKIERIQKTALRIILASEYQNYEQALQTTGLQTLKERRGVLCKKFAKNCIKNEKMCHLFPLNPSLINTRNKEKFYVQPASTERLARSAIPYMQRLLNEE